MYELGYFSTDLYQLIVFSELMQNERFSLIDENFLSSSQNFIMTRNNYLLREFRNRAQIKSINNGCIELVIAGVSCMATIIVPCLIYRLQAKKNKSQEIFFEISTNDSELNEFLYEFNKGHYGKGSEGLTWLFKRLEEKGYSVTSSGEHVFNIERIIERYEKRTIKLINKY